MVRFVWKFPFEKPYVDEQVTPVSPMLRSLPGAVEAFERLNDPKRTQGNRGNKQKAAQALGLSRQGLMKMKRLAIWILWVT
jgi:Bacterial regulatory protein, Fis family